MLQGKTLLLSGLLCLLCGMGKAQAAESWRCTKGALERNIDLYYPTAPSPLRCKVYYSKPRENVIPRVLWTAKHDAGYCRNKAAAFVARLQSWGWQCTAEPSSARPDDARQPARP